MPNTPNMNLPLGTVGTTTGLQWEQLVNAALTLIDQHTHEPGSGVLITPAALDINADLDFQNNNALNLRSSRYTPIPLADLAGDDIGCVVVADDGNLYFVDSDGNQIQMTNNGAIAGTTGSIANLVPPASATYSAVSSKFTWQSNVNTAADMDGGAVTIREKIANAKGITLQSPTSLAANYALTFPAALPASNVLMMMSSAGVLTVPAIPTITEATVRTLHVGGTGGADITPFDLSAGTSGGALRQKFYNAGATKSYEIDADFTTNTFLFQSNLATLWTFAQAGGASTIYPLTLNGSELAGSGAMSPLVLTNVDAGLAFQSVSNAAIVPFGTRSVGVKTNGGTAYPVMVSSPGNTHGDTTVRAVLTLNFSTGAVTVVSGVGFTISADPGTGAGVCNFKVAYNFPFTDQPSVAFQAFAVTGSLGAYGVDPSLGVDNTQIHFSCSGAAGLSNFHIIAIGQKGS